MDVPDLRPLSIGEILDRSVTLFVRRFALFMSALGLISIPVIVYQVIASPADVSASFGDLQKIFSSSGNPAAMRVLTEQMQTRQLALAGPAFVAMLALPLENTIVSIIAAGAFLGAAPALGPAFRAAFARYLPALVVSIGFFVIFGAGVIGVMIAVFVIVLAVAALALLSRLLALALGIVIGIAVFAALVAFGSIATLAWRIAIVAVATEDGNPIRAIASGLRRTFGGGAFVRSILVGLAAYVVDFTGVLIALGAGTVLSLLTHVPALSVIVTALAGITVSGLVSTFVVRYSIDVRVRREGFAGVLVPTQT